MWGQIHLAKTAFFSGIYSIFLPYSSSIWLHLSPLSLYIKYVPQCCDLQSYQAESWECLGITETGRILKIKLVVIKNSNIYLSTEYNTYFFYLWILCNKLGEQSLFSPILFLCPLHVHSLDAEMLWHDVHAVACGSNCSQLTNLFHHFTGHIARQYFRASSALGGGGLGSNELEF